VARRSDVLSWTVARGKPLTGTLDVPPDKSVTHRALLLGAIARGRTRIVNGLAGADCLATRAALEALGVSVRLEGPDWLVEGQGLEAWHEAGDVLDAGNSGTTMRLLSGLLVGVPGLHVLSGDGSLRARPMARIVEPLRAMGARITGRRGGRLAPLVIEGTALTGVDHPAPVASAQVKSALLLAGLHARGETRVFEPVPSRDHTERMLLAMGASLRREGQTWCLTGGDELRGGDVTVPGDVSSAMFWIVAATLVPGSDCLLRNVGLNPTRTGGLDVLRAMGADLTVLNEHMVSGEPVGDLRVRSAQLRGTLVAGELIPRLIDEIPVLALAAACAEGTTVVRDAADLRAKESDRLQAVARELGALGARVAETPDGLVIEGGGRLAGGEATSHGDHRIAMMAAIAGLVADRPVRIEDVSCVGTSYPGFESELRPWIIG